jgi:hypothetical protein
MKMNSIDWGGLDTFLDSLSARLHNDALFAVREVVKNMVLPDLLRNFLFTEVTYPTKLGKVVDNIPRPTYGRITTGITYEPTMRLINSLSNIQDISPDEVAIGSDVDYVLAQEFGWKTPSGETFPGKLFFTNTFNDSDKFVDAIVDNIFEQLRGY